MPRPKHLPSTAALCIVALGFGTADPEPLLDSTISQWVASPFMRTLLLYEPDSEHRRTSIPTLWLRVRVSGFFSGPTLMSYSGLTRPVLCSKLI